MLEDSLLPFSVNPWSSRLTDQWLLTFSYLLLGQATFEGWMEIMRDAVDARQVGFDESTKSQFGEWQFSLIILWNRNSWNCPKAGVVLQPFMFACIRIGNVLCNLLPSDWTVLVQFGYSTLSLLRVFKLSLSPVASLGISHHTVWRTWLFIAYSDEGWLCYQFSLHHSYILFKRLG